MLNDAYKVKNFFDKLATSCPPEYVGTYPQGNCGLSEILYRLYFEPRNLKKLVSFSCNMTVLELGCGGGRWALSIAPLVKKYIAVDFSQHSLDIAKKVAKREKINNIEFRHSSLQEFSPQEKYDIIYFSGVIQYIADEDIKQILSNLLPYTKPNTVIIDRSTISLGDRKVIDTQEYFSIYRTELELIDLFRSAGLTLIYKNRSYRFMRFPKIINLPIIREILPKLILILQPLSFHVLYVTNFMADIIYPLTFWYDHRFFLFNKTSK